MIKKSFRAFWALIIIFLIIAAALTVCRGLFPVKYFSIIDKYCKEYKVDSSLVLALIKAESNFESEVVSHAGAKGLMQLTQETFDYCREQMGIDRGSDIFREEENIRVGIWYLAHLTKRYDGNIKNAVAAYNAGATNVDKWLSNTDYSEDGKTLDDIPFSETKRHSEKIRRYTVIYKLLYSNLAERE